MERECNCRVLILDLGHPMNVNTTKNVINSLENVLALGSALRGSRKQISLGISVLSSDFTTLQSPETLHKNYHTIVKKLEALSETLSVSKRLRVQEYMYLLSRSIEAVVGQFQKFKKSDSRSFMQIALVTKKTASPLADILKEITKKLGEINPNLRSVEKYKVVQILNEEQEEICEDPRENPLIDCTSCLDNVQELNGFLKDWLLNPQQQLRLLLSKDPQFWIECDMYDCIINPDSLVPEGNSDLFNRFSSTTPKGTPKPSYKLEIINRLSVDGLCPTLVFGIPRRLSATTSRVLSWTDWQNNWKLFKQLCRELGQTRQGLLAKTVLPGESGYLTGFYFLTSDGDILLLNEVSSEELYFPKRGALPQRDSCEDPNAEFVIKDCLKKIEYMDECVINTFSARVFDRLRRHLEQVEESKKLLQPMFPGFKTLGEKTERKDPGGCECHASGGGSSSGGGGGGGGNSTMGGGIKGRKKKQKTSQEVEAENVHPALLTPNVVEKYRKVKSNAFNLPELGMNCSAVPK